MRSVSPLTLLQIRIARAFIAMALSTACGPAYNMQPQPQSNDEPSGQSKEQSKVQPKDQKKNPSQEEPNKFEAESKPESKPESKIDVPKTSSELSPDVESLAAHLNLQVRQGSPQVGEKFVLNSESTSFAPSYYGNQISFSRPLFVSGSDGLRAIRDLYFVWPATLQGVQIDQVLVSKRRLSGDNGWNTSTVASVALSDLNAQLWLISVADVVGREPVSGDTYFLSLTLLLSNSSRVLIQVTFRVGAETI